MRDKCPGWAIECPCCKQFIMRKIDNRCPKCGYDFGGKRRGKTEARENARRYSG